MTKLRIDLEVDGPLLKGLGPDIIADAIRGTIKDLTREGEEHAKVLASSFRKSGKYEKSLNGKVAKTGKSGRVKPYGGPRRMPYSAVLERGFPPPRHSFRGYGVIRRTAAHMQSRAQQTLQRRIDIAVRELGG